MDPEKLLERLAWDHIEDGSNNRDTAAAGAFALAALIVRRSKDRVSP